MKHFMQNPDAMLTVARGVDPFEFARLYGLKVMQTKKSFWVEHGGLVYIWDRWSMEFNRVIEGVKDESGTTVH